MLHKSNFVQQKNYPDDCLDIASFTKIKEI